MNILLKINAKLGGMNVLLEINAKLGSMNVLLKINAKLGSMNILLKDQRKAWWYECNAKLGSMNALLKIKSPKSDNRLHTMPPRDNEDEKGVLKQTNRTVLSPAAVASLVT
jgi:hypothetical protein